MNVAIVLPLLQRVQFAVVARRSTATASQDLLGFILAGAFVSIIGALLLLAKKVLRPPDPRSPGLSYSDRYYGARWRGVISMRYPVLVVGGSLIVIGVVGLLIERVK